MEKTKKTIFCVDDDTDTCELVEFVFRQKGYEVETCENLEECLEKIEENDFAAIILDNHFGNRSSLEVCQEIRAFDSTIPIVFFSGEARPSEIEKALASGANAYLTKPNDFEKLSEMVIKLIKNQGENRL